MQRNWDSRNMLVVRCGDNDSLVLLHVKIVWCETETIISFTDFLYLP